MEEYRNVEWYPFGSHQEVEVGCKEISLTLVPHFKQMFMGLYKCHQDKSLFMIVYNNYNSFSILLSNFCSCIFGLLLHIYYGLNVNSVAKI